MIVLSTAAVPLVAASVAGASQIPSHAALAEPPVEAIPATKETVTPDRAILYTFKLRLPQARWLARMLIEAGVNQKDAAAAARLAETRRSNGHDSCEITVEITRSLQESDFKLHRAVLLTSTSQTIIERRSGQLIIASEQRASETARLV